MFKLTEGLNLASIYWFEVNNGNTRTMYEIYLKLKIKAPGQCWSQSTFELHEAFKQDEMQILKSTYEYSEG